MALNIHEAFALAVPHMSKDATLTVLRGVQMVPNDGNPYVLATDRYTAVKIEFEQGEGMVLPTEPVWIDAATVKMITKDTPQKYHPHSLTFDTEGSSVILNNRIEVPLTAPPSEYPNVARLFDGFKEQESVDYGSIRINPDFLARFSTKHPGARHHLQGSGIVLHFNESGTGFIQITYPDVPGYLGLIVPMRKV